MSACLRSTRNVRSGAGLPLPGPLTLAVLLVLAANPVAAQSLPDAGQLLREAQPPRATPAPLPKPAAARSTDDAAGPRVQVRSFRVEGATRYPEATLQAELAPFSNRELGFAGLQRAADAVAERYRRDGWHAAAVLPEQDLRDGVLRILVIESRLGRAQTVPDKLPESVPRAQVEAYLARAVKPGAPLNLDALAHATALANELPGVRAASVMVGGERPGETDIRMQLAPRPSQGASIGLDNHESPSTGSTKLNLSAVLNSPAGWGEQYQLQGSLSEGKRYVRLAATAPVGDVGWRLGLSATHLAYELIGRAAVSLGTGQPNGARGNAGSVGFSASVPMWRSNSATANLVLAHDRRATRNETALGITADKRVDSSSLTLQGTLSDGLGGGAANAAQITFTRGRLDLSRSALDLATDALSAQTQGGFSRTSLTLSRLQRVNDVHSLWLSATAQRANRNLDAGEKFSLGGPQGVRAFPLLEASGDEASLATLAWRSQIGAGLQLEAFYDIGRVRRSKTPYAGSGDPQRYSLDGAGIAVEWSPSEAWRANAGLAQRLRQNPAALPSGNDSDGTLRKQRLWLSANFSF